MRLPLLCTLTVIFPLLNACQVASNTPLSAPDSSSITLKRKSSAEVLEMVNLYSRQALQFSPVSATFIGVPGYNDQFLPLINQQNREAELAFETLFLFKAENINAKQLSGQDLLTYKIFLRDRKLAIERRKFPSYLTPINQMAGAHNLFAQLGSGQSRQPFDNENDYRNFIKRAQGFADWMDSAIEAMREGLERKILLPKVIVNKVIPQLETHLNTQVEQSVFYGPLNQLPQNIKGKTREHLIRDYRDMIEQIIIPAYRRMYDFLISEYQHSARLSVGLSQLPHGAEWYRYMIKSHTTLDLTADEIHAYGQQEVARIIAEMKKVKRQVGFDGELAEFFEYLRNDPQFYFETEEQLIQAYKDVKCKIDQSLPQLFEVFPKADYDVRAVPAYRAASAAGASYEAPAPDGSRPGIFYINSHNLKAQPKFLIETLSIHEAAPGHHFQIAIQQEVDALPMYRKFGRYTVFSEGWALYAESLGKELGLFTDPYMWYGRLVDEQLRAMRLVVDTGLHAKGWSRERAVEFMLANSSMARSDVEAEVERYIVMPGQALAYKIGQREIRKLRQLGEKNLGKKFDLKKFHSQILIDGSLPMPVLEEKIKNWFATQA